MAVNVKLLRKVRKFIAEEPRRLKMRHWGIKWAPQDLDDTLPSCGTTACLAGHIILAANPKKAWPQLFNSMGYLCLGEKLNRRGNATLAAVKAAKLIGMKISDCPFGETDWEATEILAWIDRQIDAAKAKL
jgi:hypothetical protein